MPYFVEKKTDVTRLKARPDIQEIDSTRRAALGMIEVLVEMLAARLVVLTDRRDKPARRALEQLTGIFATASRLGELPTREQLYGAIDEVLDRVESSVPVTHQPTYAQAALSGMEVFAEHSPGGYTPEMLVIVLADIARQYAVLDASNTQLWFLSALRPDQLWAKPQRGFPRQMLALDERGREYSPAALHWVRSCHATAKGL